MDGFSGDTSRPRPEQWDRASDSPTQSQGSGDGPAEACPEFGEPLSLLIGGDLRPAEAEALRAHLADCRGCSRVLAQETWARRALQRAVPADAAPAGSADAFARDASVAESQIGDERWFEGMQAGIMAAVRGAESARAAGESTAGGAAASRRGLRSGYTGRARWAAVLLFGTGLTMAQWAHWQPWVADTWVAGSWTDGRPTLLEREARPLPPVDAVVWNAQRTTRPLGHHVRWGLGSQGLGGRKQAAELVDDVASLDPLQDEAQDLPPQAADRAGAIAPLPRDPR